MTIDRVGEKGLYLPHVSPFVAPILLVRKKENCSCLCADYSALNNMTMKNKFPMPRIEYILE